jgi:6-phosphogluconolactonase/glucosamine-6-phosphate isomerase/deaminase
MLGVRTVLKPEAAADDYGRRVASFLDAGGHISLALLGLGSDGHTASLFSVQDMEAAQGRTAVAVHRAPPPHRVSLTPDILARCRKVVFLVAGEAKTDIVHRILQAPGSVVAAQAVRRAPDVELWFLKT